MTNILIVYGSGEGQTAKVCEFTAERLRGRGHQVTVLPGKRLPRDFNIDQYGALIVAASVRMMKYQDYIVDFARTYHTQLDTLPSAFISVSMSEAGGHFQQQWLDKFVEECGWKPARFASFAGALMYRKYNFFTRWTMKKISKKTGFTTDTSKNHEFTDWDKVGHFADEFAIALG